MAVDDLLLEEAERKLNDLKHKFELILNSSRDPAQRKRVMEQLKQVTMDLKKLKSGLFTDKDLARYNISWDSIRAKTQPEDEQFEFLILKNIPVKSPKNTVYDPELNELFSYLKYFEKEYLPVLSEHRIKLDYSHTSKIDEFYSLYNDLDRFLTKYIRLVEDVQTTDNDRLREELQRIQRKEYRGLLVKTATFFKRLNAFLEEILKAHSEGKAVVLNPDDVIEFEEGTGGLLEGFKIIDALRDLRQFTLEMLHYLNLPNV